MIILADSGSCVRVLMVSASLAVLSACMFTEPVATEPVVAEPQPALIVAPAANGEAESADEGEIAKLPVAPVEQYDSDDVVWIQQRLQELGYYEGETNGSVGSATREAIREYQVDQGLEPVGRPTAEFREFMWRNGG
jgi:peptidoglycan hydrolase-like protein with peptidoglycan-binding domain